MGDEARREPTGTFTDSQGRLVGWDAEGQFFLPSEYQAPAPAPRTQDPNAFDYTANTVQPADLRGASGSPTTPYGPNTGEYQPEFESYYNPHGGGTFIGVRADGSKTIITQAQAMDMGYVPPPRATGDFYDLSNTDTVPGGPSDYNPGDQPWTPPITGGGTPPITGGDTPPTTGGGTPPTTGGQDPFVPPYQGTSDTSWNWGQGPVAGEYFGAPPTMNAQTMPGQESPWGVPDTPGGNPEFYRQQFSNLLTQQNVSQQAQIAAAMRRQATAAQGPQDPFDYGQMWEDQGLKDVTLGTGQTIPTSFSQNQKYAGMNNQEIWNSMKTLDAFSDRDAAGYLDNWFTNNPDAASSSDWASFSDPTAALGSINPESWQGMNHPTSIQNTLSQIMGNLYTPGQQGATAPVGYASPI